MVSLSLLSELVQVGSVTEFRGGLNRGPRLTNRASFYFAA